MGNGIEFNDRHVVGSGPFVGHIVCENHEEADVIAVYRDPSIAPIVSYTNHSTRLWVGELKSQLTADF